MRLITGIHKITTLLVLAIGVIHLVGTFFFYDTLSEAAIWFAGAGLGGIFIAFLNIHLWQRDCPPLIRQLIGLANVLFAAWLVVGFVATPALAPAIILAIGSVMSLSGIFLVLSENRPEGQ